MRVLWYIEGVPLDKAADLSPVIPQGSGGTLGGGLDHVVQQQPVYAAGVAEVEQGAAGADRLVAADVADGHVAADRFAAKVEESLIVGSDIPFNVAFRPQRGVAFPRIDVFNENVIKPCFPGIVVVVGDDHRVVAVIAVDAVDVHVAYGIITGRKQTDGGIAVAGGEVADENIFDGAAGDLRVGFIAGGQRGQVVVGGTRQVFNNAIVGGAVDMHPVGGAEMPVVVEEKIAYHESVHVGDLYAVADRVAHRHTG